MNDQNDIPRSEPPGDDGSGIGDDDFVITYDCTVRGVACPQCSGHGWLVLPVGAEKVDCPLCHASGWVSDLLADQLARQGL